MRARCPARHCIAARRGPRPRVSVDSRPARRRVAQCARLAAAPGRRKEVYAPWCSTASAVLSASGREETMSLSGVAACMKRSLN